MKIEPHLLRRCLLAEKQAQFTRAAYEDDDEICDQMYMDDLGYGINGRWK